MFDWVLNEPLFAAAATEGYCLKIALPTLEKKSKTADAC